MSRAQLTSTVEQSSGGVVAPFLAGKNKIINGDFGIWQRGTSFTTSGAAYFADRWRCFYAVDSHTISQQSFTAGNAIAGYEPTYFMRVAKNASTSDSYFGQSVEDVRTFAGQTVTLSFWAKASSAVTLTNAYINQNFGSGGSSAVDYGLYTPSLTTSWARYSATFTVPSISGKTIGTGSFIGPVFKLGTGMGNVTLDLWGVQLEAGSVATPFTTASNTLQGELALCQRYFCQFGQKQYYPIAHGAYKSSNDFRAVLRWPVRMRAVPSVTWSTTTNVQVDGVSTVTNTYAYDMTIDSAQIGVAPSTSQSTGFSSYIWFTTSTDYLQINAEL